MTVILRRIIKVQKSFSPEIHSNGLDPTSRAEQTSCVFSLYIQSFFSAATWMQSLKYWIRPSPETIHYLLTNFQPVWDVVNSIPFMQKFLMKIIYVGKSIANYILNSKDTWKYTLKCSLNSVRFLITNYYLRVINEYKNLKI